MPLEARPAPTVMRISQFKGDVLPPPVVLIHGAFCRARSMANLESVFAGAGHETFAPDLRHHKAPLAPTDLRALGITSIKDYVEDLRTLIDGFEELPILVGHSMGGLIAQLLAAQGRAKAIALLAPSAPWGVLPSHWNEVASGFGLYLNGHYWEQPLVPTYDVAADLTLARLAPQDRRAAFELMVPESGRAMFEIFQWWLDLSRATDVPPDNITCPVFCAAGALDTLNPPETVRRIASRYRSRATYRLYDEMSHWLIGEPGWQRVADDALAWLKESVS